ncbi:MAG: type II and III secretion system protein family protein [Pseudomonadota bacterium]
MGIAIRLGAITTLLFVIVWTMSNAPSASAQSVLNVVRGIQSNNLSVFIDRAVVIESAVAFEEVSVANPEIADVQLISNKSIYIFGRRRGVTSLTLLGENGRLITNVVIKVEADHSEMKQRLTELLPNEPIEVRTAAGGLILSGTVSGTDKIDQAMSLARAYAGDAVTNMMTVGGTQQVMLRVKIAEIDRGASKDLGLSLGLLGRAGNTRIVSTTGNSVRPTEREVSDNTNETVSSVNDFVSSVAPIGTFAGAFGAIFNIADSFLLDVQLDALEQKGFARTLSEPNLIALSGSESAFLAGGEVPVPVVGDDGDITITFRPVGVRLEFRPVVLDGELINISVVAEVSQVDPEVTTSGFGGFELFGFRTRRAATVVELKDGQAFAIAGLIQEEFSDVVSQVPWLGDLPVLGTLFRSTNFERGQTELVIFVSAHLVTPLGSEDEIALPTDRIAIPNEAELFLWGETTGQRGPGGAGIGIGSADFDGDYGYVLE